jgi:hypothetical protein
MHTIIERELDLQLVLSPEHGVPVPARLHYRSDDPYAVHITFHLGSEVPVHWTFARDLLIAGLRRPAGQGDVRVWPASQESDVLCLSLQSPDGGALLHAPAGTVSAWLERTVRLVRPGSEGDQIDLAEGLCALLTPSDDPGETAG